MTLFALTQPSATSSIQRFGRFVLPIGLAVLIAVFLHDYLQGTTTIVLAGWAAIAATIKTKRPLHSNRFAIITCVVIGLTWLVPVNTLLYLAIAFALFYWIERHVGSIHWLGVVALGLSMPAFYYASNVFSFPLRLQLAKAAGAIFSFTVPGVQISGNTIVHNGHEFAVDPACAGLHLFSISLLLGIFMLGLLQRKSGKAIGWKAALIYLASLVALNLLANVLRIVLLVQFAVPPEAAAHDVIGLLCLLLYVCLPACWLAKILVSNGQAREEATKVVPQKIPFLLQAILMAALVLTAQRVKSVDTYERFKEKYTQAIGDYSSSVYAPGILKLENDRVLVYVKFIRGFYDTEHNPMMCWTGSGYILKGIRKQSIDGNEMYTALLCKKEEKLYTAWWYGNSSKATTSQWAWRWDMMKGNDGYAVINVTASTEEALATEIRKMKAEQTLSPLFKK